MLTTYKMRTTFKNNYNDVFLNMTDEDCYIIGFIMADGHLKQDNNSVHITLAEIDKDILIKISHYVMSKNTVKFIKKHTPNEQNKSGFAIYSKCLYDRIVLSGVEPGRKTGKERFINFKDSSKTNAFIRGYFDGDGCVRVYKRKYKEKFYDKVKVTFTCASKKMLEDLKSYLILQGIKIPEKAIYSKEGCYSLDFSSIESVYNFGKLIYKDSSMHLERKYNKFKILDDIVRTRNESTRDKQK